MTANIQVKLRPKTPAGRLYPSYDTGADLLTVGSHVARAWPFGINIDGRVIFDIDEQRILANFDLVISKRYWKIGEYPSLPPQVTEADLEIDESSLKHKNFHLPLKITSNQDKTWALIEFGPAAVDDVLWIKLSDACFAQVTNNQLCGFLVIL